MAEKMTHSVTVFADSFEKASNHATSAGMKLTHPSQYQYQLRSIKHGYIVDAYSRNDGGRRLCKSKGHPSPKLKLKEDWDLFDLVKSAIKAWNPPECCNGESRLPPFDLAEKTVTQVDSHRVAVVPPARKVVGGFLVRVRMPNGDGPIDMVLTESELATAIARAFCLESP